MSGVERDEMEMVLPWWKIKENDFRCFYLNARGHDKVKLIRFSYIFNKIIFLDQYSPPHHQILYEFLTTVCSDDVQSLTRGCPLGTVGISYLGLCLSKISVKLYICTVTVYLFLECGVFMASKHMHTGGEVCWASQFCQVARSHNTKLNSANT